MYYSTKTYHSVSADMVPFLSTEVPFIKLYFAEPERERNLTKMDEQKVFIHGLSKNPGTPQKSEIDALDRYFIEHYGISLSDVHCDCDPDSPDLYYYLLNHTKTYREGHPSYRKPFHIEDQLRDVREQASDELKAAIDERLNQ